jgi:hypothetical protein
LKVNDSTPSSLQILGIRLLLGELSCMKVSILTSGKLNVLARLIIDRSFNPIVPLMSLLNSEIKL